MVPSYHRKHKTPRRTEYTHQNGSAAVLRTSIRLSTSGRQGRTVNLTVLEAKALRYVFKTKDRAPHRRRPIMSQRTFYPKCHLFDLRFLSLFTKRFLARFLTQNAPKCFPNAAKMPPKTRTKKTQTTKMQARFSLSVYFLAQSAL